MKTGAAPLELAIPTDHPRVWWTPHSLGDEDARVRAAAFSALGRIGPDAAAGLVEALQKDKSARIRAGAAAVLPTISDQPPVAVPALIGALTDTDAEVRAAAARALKKIDPQAAKKVGVK